LGRRLQAVKLLWDILTLPFWVAGFLLRLVGRALLALLGFAIMVLGAALVSAGIFVPVGVALFAVGLILFLRAVS
jgi:hypothetical protein